MLSNLNKTCCHAPITFGEGQQFRDDGSRPKWGRPLRSAHSDRPGPETRSKSSRRNSTKKTKQKESQQKTKGKIRQNRQVKSELETNEHFVICIFFRFFLIFFPLLFIVFNIAYWSAYYFLQDLGHIEMP